MRDRYWIVRAAAWVLCSLVVQGCAIGGIKVSGRVVDAETGQPVKGAYVYAKSGHKNFCPVELASCHFVVEDTGLTRTDVNGHYAFDKRFHFGGGFTSKKGYVIVYKSGYITASKMVAKHWKPDNVSTPENYVSENIPSQYFYGTGDYSAYYKTSPLNRDHPNYFLSKKSLRELSSYPYHSKPRLVYLLTVVGHLPETNNAASTLKRAMYKEAKHLIQNRDDRKIAHKICLQVYSLSAKTSGHESCPP